MKVDYNLDIVRLRPTNSLEEIGVLPLNKRFARGDVISPISYRDANVVESGNGTARSESIGTFDA